GKKLKYPLRHEILEEKMKIVDADPAGNKHEVDFGRKLGDGGIFTAEQALKYGLIDQIGYVDEAIAQAKNLAKLDDRYKVISYEKPKSLLEVLVGVKSTSPGIQAGWEQLAGELWPRLWYLAPQSGLSGLM